MHVLDEGSWAVSEMTTHIAAMFTGRVEVVRDGFVPASTKESADVFVAVLYLILKYPFTLCAGFVLPLHLIESPFRCASCVDDAEHFEVFLIVSQARWMFRAPGLVCA